MYKQNRKESVQCNNHLTSKRINLYIQISIEGFKAVIFEKNELERRDMSIPNALLVFWSRKVPIPLQKNELHDTWERIV